MTRSLLFFSIIWFCCSSDCMSQHSSTWADAKLDTVTFGNSDDYNPALQRNSAFSLITSSWLVFERHTIASSDIAAKRFLRDGTWDTATVLIASSTPAAEQTRPSVAGFPRTPSNVLAAWQKKNGSAWNVYYAFYLADSLSWQAPQALTSDSLDCSDVRVRSYFDVSFAIFWKHKGRILYRIVRPDYRSAVDTAAVSNTDSLEYDIGNITYGGNGQILFTKKDSTGIYALWERVFLPDSLYKQPIQINTNGLNVLRPRYLQTLRYPESWFSFEAQDGKTRDLWGNDYSGLSRLTITPLVDERNCSSTNFPMVTKQSGVTLQSSFPWMYSIYEADSTVIINPGSSVVASTGYNRAPRIDGYAFGAGGWQVAAVWESNRDGRTHLYSKNRFQWNGSVSRESYAAAEFSLSQNYPNPFNPATTFRFSLPSSQIVSMKIFDVLGREVAMLVNERLDAGSYRVDWNASEQTSGTYFAVIKTALHSETKKIVLLK